MACKLVLLLAFAVPAAAVEVSPIEKVIQMVADLQAKVISEGESAQKLYSEFAEWCEDRSRNIGFEIKTGNADVADLKATIDSESAEIGSLTAKIEELASSTATNEKDLHAAEKIRAAETAAFAAEEKELVEAIDTLGRAVTILSREMQKGGAAFVQLQNAKSVVEALKLLVQGAALNSVDASKLTALVQSSQESDDADAGAPDAAVYTSQSGNIVETLQGLEEKAEGQLAGARKAEATALHNFEMLKQSLEDAIKFADDDMADAKKGLAVSGEKKSAAEGDLEVTSKDLAEDIAQKKDLHHDCMTKASDFEAEVKSRGEELAALANAKKVIQEATGGAAKLSYGLEQMSFLQRAQLAPTQRAAIRFVRDFARKHSTPLLAQLASRMDSAMQSGDDAFGKVKGLISDMLVRLEGEAAADASEKQYCDKEMSETKAKKDDKDAEVEKLSTKIDQMSSKSAKLKEQVAALQNALAQIASSQAEMDKMRHEEHSAFTSNKQDMDQGLEGVKLALKILREYYSQDDKAHSAADGASSGIIGLLEVCESDFSKGVAEMVTVEETAQTSYDRATKENQIETAEKTQAVKYKNQESAGLDKAVAEAKTDRDGVQEELDAILEYDSQIKKRCVAVAETYADRTAARDQELAGLKEALEILSGGAALIQKSRSFLKRKSNLDINQKVYIQNAPVLGDGQGDAALNQCRAFTAAHVANVDAPVVKVCGTGIKATVFLRGRCEGYYEHSHTIGKCDSGAASTTCDTYSPADLPAFGHYQSYKIEQCN